MSYNNDPASTVAEKKRRPLHPAFDRVSSLIEPQRHGATEKNWPWPKNSCNSWQDFPALNSFSPTTPPRLTGYTNGQLSGVSERALQYSRVISLQKGAPFWLLVFDSACLEVWAGRQYRRPL